MNEDMNKCLTTPNFKPILTIGVEQKYLNTIMMIFRKKKVNLNKQKRIKQTIKQLFSRIHVYMNGS